MQQQQRHSRPLAVGGMQSQSIKQPSTPLPTAYYLPHNPTVRFHACSSIITTMYVIKRDGRQVPVRFDKITARLQRLAVGLDHCDPVGSNSLRSR